MLKHTNPLELCAAERIVVTLLIVHYRTRDGACGPQLSTMHGWHTTIDTKPWNFNAILQSGFLTPRLSGGNQGSRKDACYLVLPNWLGLDWLARGMIHPEANDSLGQAETQMRRRTLPTELRAAGCESLDVHFEDCGLK